MANGRSCCCAGLSKGWWWLLTLLGLPFLYFLMLSSKWTPIEKDIQSRTQQQLTASNADWTNVEIEKRGRDVLLTGTATSDEARDQAIQTALSVEGVRIVENDISVKSLSPPSLQARFENGKYILEGTLSSQTEIDEIVKILAEKVGADNIVNKLTVADGYAKTGGALTIAGMLMSQASIDADSSAFNAIAEALGLNLTNNLSLDLDAIAAKKAAEDAALAEKMAKEKAAAEAMAKTEAEKKSAAEALAKEEADKKAATEALAKKEAEANAKQSEEEMAAAKKAEEEKARAERMAAAKADVDACQAKLTSTMTGKTILFETNKANIKNSSFTLLKEVITVINECRSKVPDSRIAISGHTDSRGSDAYNLALSQRRADAVKAYLINAGVDTSIITSKGYGETQPIAPNDTAKDRAKNRRITFSVQ